MVAYTIRVGKNGLNKTLQMSTVTINVDMVTYLLKSECKSKSSKNGLNSDSSPSPDSSTTSLTKAKTTYHHYQQQQQQQL